MFIQRFGLLILLIGYLSAPWLMQAQPKPWHLPFVVWLLAILASYWLIKPQRTDDDI